ncbi:MAG TPA: IS110 family transposase [Cyclobacteriaceae bacterium]|jgi:transposase|nr:IS110 family transposase [Cyclobacteriaceae bacterium]HRF32651.1 IS110 family transposase [Cyclobacteriaceae bacterium]
MANYYFGIDVSKKTLDVALLKDGVLLSSHVIDNDPHSIDVFFAPYAKQFQLATDQAWICMEHTGIYNYPLLKSLGESKFHICVEPALQIKQSQGMTRGKSDAVDAVRIAQYAYKNRDSLKVWKPQPVNLHRLKALLSQRDLLIKTKLQLEVSTKECKGYLDAQLVKDLVSNSKNSLKAIDKSIYKVEEKIYAVVKSDKSLNTLFHRATSVTGIGPITAFNLIVATGAFEQIKNPKKFACHAGVAPFEHRSGTAVRGRTRVSKMADMGMKRLLHMAALSATQCEGELRNYYLRKVADGKNKMAVLNAVRNKLITRVFVCINQNRDYQKKYERALV